MKLNQPNPVFYRARLIISFLFLVLPFNLGADDNLSPGEVEMLHVLNGMEIWHQKIGPNYRSLESCDLGQGMGVFKGVVESLPMFFDDTSKIMTLKERLTFCIESIQGFSYSYISSNELIQKNIFSILMWLNHINGENNIP